MSKAQDLYAILGVPPEAQTEDVRRAYRALARRLHPDVNPNKGAANQFKDIAAANQILGEELARREFDKQRQKNEPDRAYFTLRVTPSKRALPVLQEPQVLYLLVELQAEQSQALQGSQGSTPLNLALVIDQSVSMKGVRMEHTKVAAYQIIDQLSEKDMISVISFNDRAHTMVKASPVKDRADLKAMIMPLQADGGTEIFQGVQAGFNEVKRNVSRKYVNHIILITDGRTYGDEQQTLNLAEQAAKEGIGISALGIGDEWNDTFLDQLVSRTGGSAQYVTSPNAVVRFLNDQVRGLSEAFAERITLSLAPDADVKLESAFRLMPNPQPLIVDANTDPLQIGQLKAGMKTSILLQLLLPDLPEETFRSLMRIDVTGDIMSEQRIGYKTIADISLEVANDPLPEDPPLAILDALGKLSLHRMQQKAAEDLEKGETEQATKRLQNLATKLFDAGHDDLANAALGEARRISQSRNGETNSFSNETQKALKFGTRKLLLSGSNEGNPNQNVNGGTQNPTGKKL